MRIQSFVAGLFPALLAATPATPTASIELAQSIPGGTSGLAEPGLRSTLEVWLELIRSARRTLELGQMYVAHRPGGSLEPVLAALEEAGRRGVRIRVLLARHMFDQDVAARERLRSIPGAEVRAIDFGPINAGIQHAKYWIVDGREIFVGSQNLDWRALTEIHELGIRIRDAGLASQLGRLFELDWEIAASGRAPTPPISPPPPRGGRRPELELVASPPNALPPGTDFSLPLLLELLDGARRSLRIQLLDYAVHDDHGTAGRWTELDAALRRAAARGVRVELLVSHWNVRNARHLADLRSLARVPGIQVRVATIPERPEGVIPYARVAHAKYMVVDEDLLWLGTSNWSRNYFHGSRNLELVVRRGPEARAALSFSERLWTSRYARDLVSISVP